MKEIRIKISNGLQNKIEQFIDHACEEYRINDALYGNILMSVMDVLDLVQQLSREADLNELYISAYRELDKFHLEITNLEKIDLRYYINELQLKNKGDVLFLVRSLTDEMQFSENGELLNLAYHLDVDRQLKNPDRRSLLKEYLSTSNKNIRV